VDVHYVPFCDDAHSGRTHASYSFGAAHAMKSVLGGFNVFLFRHPVERMKQSPCLHITIFGIRLPVPKPSARKNAKVLRVPTPIVATRLDGSGGAAGTFLAVVDQPRFGYS
jgi:hypothetical protein